MNDITMYSPRNLDELVPALAAATGLSKIIAGGTDLTIAMHEGEVCPDVPDSYTHLTLPTIA